jgi:hypothetical protein
MKRRRLSSFHSTLLAAVAHQEAADAEEEKELEQLKKEEAELMEELAWLDVDV